MGRLSRITQGRSEIIMRILIKGTQEGQNLRRIRDEGSKRTEPCKEKARSQGRQVDSRS